MTASIQPKTEAHAVQSVTDSTLGSRRQSIATAENTEFRTFCTRNRICMVLSVFVKGNRNRRARSNTKSSCPARCRFPKCMGRFLASGDGWSGKHLDDKSSRDGAALRAEQKGQHFHPLVFTAHAVDGIRHQSGAGHPVDRGHGLLCANDSSSAAATLASREMSC